MTEFTNADIRSELRLRWSRRDWRGVWFYGTWLSHRYYFTAAVLTVAIVSVPFCVLLLLLR